MHDLFREEAEDDARGLPLDPILHLLVNGRVPASVAEVLASSRLLALAKPNSGVRPIAIGEVWTRLASRAAMLHFRDDFQELLAPYQLGVAVPGGSEAVVLGIRTAMEAHPDWLLVSMDLANAFNTVDRSLVFEALREAGPAMRLLLPYVRMQYGQPGHLWYKDGPRSVHLIRSCTGTRQGDPLAGALFALAHLQALKAVRAAHPECYIPTIADDSYLMGPPEAVRAAYATFVDAMAAIQLKVKPSKCCQYAPGLDASAFIPAVPVVEEGLKILGAPFGSFDYQQAFFQRAVDAKSEGLALVPKLADAQAAHILLVQSFVPRLHFLLRCTPLSEGTADLANTYHASLLDTMELVLGYLPGSMPQGAITQMMLPTSRGGLGLVPPTIVAPAAFLGAWALSASRIPTLFPGDAPVLSFVQDAGTGPHPLQAYLQTQWTLFQTLLPHIPPLADMQAAPLTKFQATCSTRHADVLAGNYLHTLPNAAAKARFRSVAGPHAGAWLHSGGGIEGLCLENEVFITAVRLRLGLPHPGVRGLEVCTCGAAVDRQAHHLLHCSDEGALVSTHNSVRNCLASIFRRAGFVVQMEELGQLMDTGEDIEGQKTDLVLTKDGRKTLCDVTVRSPTCPSRVRRASEAGLMAAQDGEMEKERVYTARPAGVHFVAASFEPYGAWGRKINAFLSTIWPLLSRGHASSPKLRQLRPHLQQVLSVTLVRGVASHLLHKFRKLPRAPSESTPTTPPMSTADLLHEIPYTGTSYFF